MLKINPLINKNQYTNCQVIDKNYDVDHIKSFKKLKKKLTEVFSKPEIDLIVIDGISDLRRMAADLWSVENADNGKPKAIYGARAWGEVNTKVKKILYRLFNYARVKRKKVIITSWLAADYDAEGNNLGTKSLDVKEFITSRVDETIMVRRKGTKFAIKRENQP